MGFSRFIKSQFKKNKQTNKNLEREVKHNIWEERVTSLEESVFCSYMTKFFKGWKD